MRKILAWVRGRLFRTMIFAFAAVLLGAHLLANWQSERRWQEYRAAAQARGVKLTMAEMAPPPVPDAENFASLPMWKAVFATPPSIPFDLPRAPDRSRPKLGNASRGVAMEWAPWQQLFLSAGYITETSEDPARDVLRGLDHFAPQFAEWSQWRTRPLCRFPLDYQAGAMMAVPHLSPIQTAATVFALQMRAHLALGDSAAAAVAFREGLQAPRCLDAEPTFLSGLVQVATLTLLLEGVGGGLANHQWTDADLQRIVADLATVSVLKTRQRALAGERAFFNTAVEQLIETPAAGRGNQVVAMLGAPTPSAGLMVFIPARVFRDNRLRSNHYFDELLAQVDEAGFHQDRPTPSGPENLRGLITPYYYFLFRTAAPVYGGVLERFLRMQTRLEQTRIAIALERCRLGRGEFPETLAELVPDFLDAIPRDAASQQPMTYRRIDDRKTFALYGFGPNGVDDGGVFDPKELSESRQKDDVWMHAPVLAGEEK